MNNYDNAYALLLHHLMNDNELGQSVSLRTNERTGVRVRELCGGASMKLDLSDERVPIPGNRAYYPKAAAAETAWQLHGTKDPAFMMKHAPRLWEKFIEDGEIKSAYGWRWRHAFGRDQIVDAIIALSNDETSRQCWIQAWDPSSDGLGRKGPKNIPCPVGFTLNVDANKSLHTCVFIRSSDAYVGLPYDVMNYAMLTAVFARTLNLALGSLHVTLANVHLYEPHWDLAREDLETGWYAHGGWRLSSKGMPEIMADPDGYVFGHAHMRPHPLAPRRFPEVIE